MPRIGKFEEHVESRDPRDRGALCNKCPLNRKKPVFPFPIKRSTKLIIVGMAPGNEEVRMGEFYAGSSSNRLHNLLDMAKIPSSEVHLTNALLCQPPSDLSSDDWTLAINCCRPRLKRELQPSKSRVIMALGGKGLQSTVQRSVISDWVGAPLQGAEPFQDYQVMPAYHVAWCARNPGLWPTFYEHLKRTWKLAQGKLPKWKWPQKFWLEPNDDMVEALKRLLKAKSLGVDIETTSKDSPLIAAIDLIGFASMKDAVAVPWPAMGAFKTTAMAKEVGRLTRQLLASPKIGLTMQNGHLFDSIALKKHGFKIKKFDFDTMLAHRIVRPEAPHNLGFIACEYLSAPRWKSSYRLTGEKRALYNARDCGTTEILRHILSKELDTTNQGWPLMREAMELGALRQEMKERGCATVPKNKKRHDKALKSRRAAAVVELHAIDKATRDKRYKYTKLNPNSSVHLHKLFFKQLKAPVVERSEETEAPSLNEKALQKYIVSTNSTLAAAGRALLRYRRWNKLHSTYIKHLGPRVHPSFNDSPITGRLSASEPNLTNIPQPKTKILKKKGKGGERKKVVLYPGLRDLFGPDKGNIMVVADYSQIELRIIAGLSGDKPYLDAYKKGLDVHDMTARSLFGIGPKETVAKQLRTRAKNFNYNKWYGGSARTIWSLLVLLDDEIYLEDVEYMCQQADDAHPDILSWHKEILAQAEKDLFIECPLSGRREHFFDPDDVRPSIVYNFKVQAAAAQVLRTAMLRVRKRLNKYEQLTIACHDELVTQGPDPDRLEGILNEEMDCHVMLNGRRVHLPIDVSRGKTWGEAA